MKTLVISVIGLLIGFAASAATAQQARNSITTTAVTRVMVIPGMAVWILITQAALGW